jgi:sugar lactone lactonase YvrE
MISRNLPYRPRLIVALISLALTGGMPSNGWCANLWAALSSIGNGGLASYTAPQLNKSGTPTPFYLSGYKFVFGFAFDRSRNLWACVNHFEVVRYNYKQLKDLKDNSSPTPDVIITSMSSLNNIYACNFDRKGNLWVADIENNTLNEISKQQLTAGSGDITPVTIITLEGISIPTFIAFDRADNAWIADGGNSQLAEFSASELETGGTKSAAILLSDDGSGTSLSRPGQIVFDGRGNLWVPNFSSNTVIEYARADLAHSGSPMPRVKLNSAIFNEPIGAAFDGLGELVITNAYDGTISKFRANQLRASGAPTPKVVATGSDLPVLIAFGPSL